MVREDAWYDFDLFLKEFYLCTSREGKGGRKRGRETSMCGCLSCAPYWGLDTSQACALDWELNWQLFGSQAGIQSTELHSQGMLLIFLNVLWLVLSPNMWCILGNVPCALEKMYILRIWGEMLWRYQLNLFEIMYHLKQLSHYWFSVWKIYPLKSMGC